MKLMPGAPLDMSLRSPNQERLDQLAAKVYDQEFTALEPANRAKVYELAVAELQASALVVLAQFLGRLG